MRENKERIRERVLALIESEFESDAAFERAMGLGDKTVNNWRRARSSSFMKMLMSTPEMLSGMFTNPSVSPSSVLYFSMVSLSRMT